MSDKLKEIVGNIVLGIIAIATAVMLLFCLYGWLSFWVGLRSIS